MLQDIYGVLRRHIHRNTTTYYTRAELYTMEIVIETSALSCSDTNVSQMLSRCRKPPVLGQPACFDRLGMSQG